VNCPRCNAPMLRLYGPHWWITLFPVTKWRCPEHPDADTLEVTHEYILPGAIHSIVIRGVIEV